MNDHNAQSPSTPWVEKRMELLRRVRETGGVPIGWGADEVSPPAANTLAAAGLVTIETTDAGRVCRPAK